MKTQSTIIKRSLTNSNVIKKLLITVSIVLLINITACCQRVDTVGTALFVTKSFYSKTLNENRTIRIYTPDRMKDNGVYPVLYLLDGETLMTMVAGQVQYLSESYKIIPSMIIVGIENTDRTRDLTPTHSITGPDGKPDTSANAFGKNSGGGEKLIQFMQQELFPYIEKNYPAAPYRVLCGHSLGGLMAVHALLNHPSLFNAFIAISPSLQWDNGALIKQLAETKQHATLKSYIFFSDASEGLAFHQNQLRLDSLLKQINIPGLDFKYSYYPEETHISEPVKAFYDGIRYIYPDWYLNYNSSAFRKTITAKMLKDKYDSLSSRYGYKVIPLQDEMNQVSRMIRKDPKKINDAIELLELNLLSYPQSSIVHELLGDTYLLSGDNKKALANFEKAFSANPGNESLKQKIKKIPVTN